VRAIATTAAAAWALSPLGSSRGGLPRDAVPTRDPSLCPRVCPVGWGFLRAVPSAHESRLRGVGIVLCSRRLMSVEGTVSQTLEPFLACHPHAF